MSAVDNLKLEVAFASGPDDAAPTWTNVTAYWLLSDSTQITRGRQDEQSDISPGTLSLTLDNSDGRFTAGNTSSPYYPNVKIRKQIRITYQEGGTGTTYAIFHGHVDEWPLEWPGGNNFAQATVTASDRTKRLGQMLPLRGVPQESILADDPDYYYPLTEPSNATVAADLMGSGAGMSVAQVGTGGSVSFGGGTGPSTDSAASVMFEPSNSANGKYLLAQRPAGFNTATGVSFEFALATQATSSPLLTLWDATGTANIKVAVDASGYLSVSATDVGFVGFSGGSMTSFPKVNDGSVHHVGVRFHDTGGFYIEGDVYLDGVVQAAFVLTFPAPSSMPVWTQVQVAGADSPSPYDTGASVGSGSISHVAIGTYNHSEAVLTGFTGESSDARITRVAGWVGMGSFLTLDTGASTSLSHIDATGRTALDVMKDVATTENGQLFGSRDGNIAFHARTRRYNATTAVTLSAASEEIGTGLRFRTNDQFLVNDVTVTSPAAGSTRVMDSTSITDYGYARESVDIYTTSEVEANAAANWRLGTRKTPAPRAEGLEVDLLTASSATRVAVVQVDVSSRVALSGLPSTTAGSTTADLIVEGYVETISRTEWTRSFNTSPASTQTVWKLGVAGASELGTTTRLAY